ncbi:MAG: DegT/DnrJ/EryC1/StrS family aminotransferase [Bacteriovoracaceae bacterium]
MIKYIDFDSLHNENLRTEALEIFSEIMKNNSFVDGPYNKQFENDFAKLQGAKICRLVANGTDALEISLLVHGIERGDHVAVPGITFYATAEAILNVGAVPVFVDVDPETGLACPESFKKICDRFEIKAFMSVHIYGLPADIPTLNKIAVEKDIPVIEDAAQACGAFINGKPIGASGNLTTFSFYPTKNLGAMGDAGAILCETEEQAHKIDQIRNHGRGSDGKVMGRNSRCDHFQAAVLCLKMKQIEAQNDQRKAAAKRYHEGLSRNEIFKLLPSKYLETSSFHIYPIRFETSELRQKFQDHMKEVGIGTSNFYMKALSQEPALSHFQGEKENAEKFATTVAGLPMHAFLTEEHTNEVIQHALSFKA